MYAYLSFHATSQTRLKLQSPNLVFMVASRRLGTGLILDPNGQKVKVKRLESV